MNKPYRLIMLVAPGLLWTAAAMGAETIERGPRYPLPAWDQQFDNPANRFLVLSNWNKEAVLDEETGLVWELSPSSGVANWGEALKSCRIASTGGRFGWRLPQQEELASLAVPDPMNAGIPDLPAGNPFQNAATGNFWTATTVETDTARAWTVAFGTAVDAFGDKAGATLRFWCVRGGHGAQNPQ